MPSIATDYAADRGDPSPYLEAIARAGFDHIHWCHHWNTDFLYSAHEIAQIRRWLDAFGLKLLDLHGSAGAEKAWMALEEYRRRAGVELVENRLRMTAELGGDAVVMHLPDLVNACESQWDQVRRTLDDLQPCTEETGVCIALENFGSNRPEDWQAVERVMRWYPAAAVGFCWDAGHAHIGAYDGLGHAERLAERLVVTHLHDNDGTGDQHRPPYDATLDWERLAGIVARSPYRKPLTLEVGMRASPIEEEGAFLRHCLAIAVKLEGLVAAARAA
jgi:sugar phosphate isomerase/epimerase